MTIAFSINNSRDHQVNQPNAKPVNRTIEKVKNMSANLPKISAAQLDLKHKNIGKGKVESKKDKKFSSE